jgi:hypothetical protein
MTHELPDYDANLDDDPADDSGQTRPDDFESYYETADSGAQLSDSFPLPGEVYIRYPSTGGDPAHEIDLSRDQKLAGGAIDVILGRGMVALEEAVAGETRINTGDLWAALKRTPALAATFDKGTEAVFGAAGLIASEREVMRGYILEALPAAEVAEYTGRTVRGTENLIVSASKALRLLPQRLACTKSPTKGRK